MKDKRRLNLIKKPVIGLQNGIVEFLQFSLQQNVGQSIHEVSYAINISKIMRIIACPKFYKFENTSHYPVVGSICYQNEMIQILDLSNYLFGRDFRQESLKTSDIILLSYLDTKIGLLVDHVERTHYCTWDAVKGPSGLSANSSESGSVVIDQQVYVILDLEKIYIDSFGLELNDEILEPVDYPYCIGLIEDSATIRSQLNEKFSQNGYKISNYVSGNDFLNSQDLDYKHFDALIIDIEMPGMDGLSLVSELSKDSRYKEVGKFIYSSLSDQSIRRVVDQKEVDGFVVKFKLAKLSEMIYKFLKQK